MSNPIESKAVRGWIRSVANHEYFPYIVDFIRSQNRMSGWEQEHEWMEMKANGYRSGFEEALKILGNLTDISYTEEDQMLNDMGFEQNPELADYVDQRFPNE